ncbi:helix-turn-helix transcriptional regulator [Paracidovorax wautersii]|nr:AlpA family phage regulatory protein [Paracidovorax wautersii]
MTASSAATASRENNATNETWRPKKPLQKGQNEQGANDAPRPTRGHFFGRILSSVRHPLQSAMGEIVQTGDTMKGNPMSLNKQSTKPTRDILLRLQEVLQRLPVSRASLYAGMRTGLYPQPIRVGKRTVAWKESEIDACIASMNRGSAAL